MPSFDPTLLLEALSPPAILAVVGLAAAIEYLFPPFWGDLLILVGFFFAGQGRVAPWAVFVVAFGGSALGAAAAWTIGRRYGMAAVRRFRFGRRLNRAGARVKRLYLRFGAPALVANRFIPVVRAVMLYAAGALGLRFAASMVYSSLSNLLWVAVLAWVGVATGGHWERVLAAFEDTHRWTGVAAALLVLAVAAFASRRLASRDDPSPR